MEMFANQYTLIWPTHNRKEINERKPISIKSLTYSVHKPIAHINFRNQ